MKGLINRIIIGVLIIIGFAAPVLSEVHQTGKEDGVLKYRLLFFKNDDRIWIILPPKTTLVEIYPSSGVKTGWVRAYNRHGETLALDDDFHGDVILTTSVKKPSVWQGKLVVTRHDEKSAAIFTCEDTAFVEIINARNGFDGTVFLRDRNKNVQSSQSGLDIKIVNFK